MEKLTLRASGNSTPNPAAITPGADIANGSNSGPNPAGSPGVGLKGTVSETDALKAADGAKIEPFSGLGTPLAQPGTTGQSVAVGGMIDGLIAITMIDAILPAILVLILYKAGMQLKKSDLQLTEKEKGTLGPILQKCLDQLLINFNNPWVAFGVTYIVILASKVVEKGGIKIIDSKLEKMKAKDVMKTAEQAQKSQTPPPGDSLKSPVSNSPDINPPGFEPTPEQITLKARKKKVSKAVARTMLIQLHSQGKPLFN